MPFTDVKETDWFYDSVRYVFEKGLFKGMSETEFGPNTEMNRAMLVTVLYRAAGEPPVNSNTGFTDVGSDTYYANAVAWAKQFGIVNGVTATKFDPNKPITREQIVTIIFRYAKYMGYDTSASGYDNLRAYQDAGNVSDYALEAMRYAVGTGLIKGKTNTSICPRDNATRAEIATILQRFLEANQAKQ